MCSLFIQFQVSRVVWTIRRWFLRVSAICHDRVVSPGIKNRGITNDFVYLSRFQKHNYNLLYKPSRFTIYYLRAPTPAALFFSWTYSQMVYRNLFLDILNFEVTPVTSFRVTCHNQILARALKNQLSTTILYCDRFCLYLYLYSVFNFQARLFVRH